MSRNSGTTTRAESRPGAPLALVVFLLVCGIVLLLFGGRGAGPVHRAPKLELAPRLLALSQAVQHAERSLDARNYGACGETLHNVQDNLAELLNQVQKVDER